VDKQDPKLEYGEIWRDQQGAYHADLKGTKRQWKPEDLGIYSFQRSHVSFLLPPLLEQNLNG
jgi:hypothetical protein